MQILSGRCREALGVTRHYLLGTGIDEWLAELFGREHGVQPLMTANVHRRLRRLVVSIASAGHHNRAGPGTADEGMFAATIAIICVVPFTSLRRDKALVA